MACRCIGQRTTFRWLGTSVAELVIAQAKRPFRRLETLLVLKPRDVFWMTICRLLPGARRCPDLSRAPRARLRYWTSSWLTRKPGAGATPCSQARQAQAGKAQDYQGLRLMAPKGLLDLAARTLRPAGRSQCRHFLRATSRFSLRKTAPNLEVHVPFPDPRAVDARDYFQALRDLGRAVSERN